MFVMAGTYYTTTKRELHGYSFPMPKYFLEKLESVKLLYIEKKEKENY